MTSGKCSEEDEVDIFARPVCLIDTDDAGRFIICQRALDRLAALGDGQTVVAAIVGRYRSGKSYLMNRLCGHTSGFPLGSTVQAKTKGIWVWVRVHPIHPEKYLVLLDTEGLGDAEKGNQMHDDAICILATLLSSCLIFNSIGTITYDSLMQLQDFGLELEIDGREVTSDEYFESSLSAQPSSGLSSTRAVRERNRIKLSLRRLFPRRKCFTFVRPVPVKKMKYLDQMGDEDLEPEFIDNTGTFIHYILENVRTKIIDGRPITGKELSLLVKQFVDQINGGGLLRVNDVVEVIRSAANKEALDAALEEYVKRMVEGLNPLPISEDKLSSIQETCLNNALSLFHSKTVFLNDGDSSFQSALTNEISKIFAGFAKNNERERVKLCEEVLEQFFDERISPNVSDGFYSRKGGFIQFRKDMDQIERDYYDALGTSAARDVLLKFRENHIRKESIFKQAEFQADLEEERTRVEITRALAAERRKEAAERESRFKSELMTQKESSHQQIVHQLNRQAENQKQQIQRSFDELTRQKLEEHERLLREGFKREADQLRAEIDNLRHRL